MDVEVIANEIERQGRNMAAWQQKQAAEVTELRSYMEDLEVKFNRQGLVFGNSSQSRDALETKSYIQYLRTGREPEHKAMVVGNDEAGGYLAPSQLEQQLTKYLRERSPMRQLARVVTVQSGAYQMPAAKTSAAYSWVGETASRPETDSPTIKMVTVPTCEVYACPSISQTLLDDNVFNLEQWLIQELAQLEAAMANLSDPTGDDLAVFSCLSKLASGESAKIAMHARSMRLTQQSRLKAETASSHGLGAASAERTVADKYFDELLA